MKTVIVNTHMADHLGGSQIQCDLIANGLYERGHDIIYLAIDKVTDDYKTKYPVIGVSRNSNDLAKKIVEIDPDILYWRYNKRYFYKTVKRVANKRIKIIFAVSNIKDLQEFGNPVLGKPNLKNILRYLKRKLRNRYNHLGFRYVDGLTTNNIEHLAYSSVEKKQYIPNAITDKISEFEWPRPYILWVANIKKRKRPEIYIQSAKQFENEGIDFLMVGKISDSSYNWIQQSNQIPSNVHYLGQKTVEEVNGILSGSLFLITTSTPEGFSNNLIQAWMQKKPTISFEFDPEGHISREKLGIVCDNDRHKFYSAISKLLNNPVAREQMGARAGKFAENYFSKQKSIDLIESFMLKLSENTIN